jgi:hypothetical protein
MPRLKQRRSNIQYGGTKVSIRESKDNSSFTPCSDEEQIGRSLLHNTKSINLITDSSVGSCLFYGELVDDKDSLVLLESQTISTDGSSPLPLTDAKHVPENVGKGMRCQKYCMKVMLFDSANHGDKISEIEYRNKRKKEITNKLIVDKEKRKQQGIYETSVCMSGNDGGIVADGIASIVLKPEEFEDFFKKKVVKDETSRVYQWILDTAKGQNIDVCIYFMDYLDGFITMGSVSKPDKELVNKISTECAAYILYILNNTKDWSFDMHNGNIMVRLFEDPAKSLFLFRPKTLEGLRIIDFGRTLNFSNPQDNEYIRTTFETFLTDLQNEVSDISNMINVKTTILSVKNQLIKQKETLDKFMKDLYIFFGSTTESELRSKFDEYHTKLINLDLSLLNDDKIPIKSKQSYLFECLMFLSFIDLMINWVKWGKQGGQCSIMQFVFCDATVDNFENVLMFMQHHCLNYNNFLSKNTHAIRIKIEANFRMIYDKLQTLLFSCKKRITIKDLRGITRVKANEEAKSVLEGSIESAVDASEKKARIEEARSLISTDSKDTARWENFIGRGGSDKKRKYRSRRISKHSKSIKHRRYHYRHFTKRNLKIT